MRCPNCKRNILDTSDFCIYCYCDIAEVKEQNRLLRKQKIEEKERLEEESRIEKLEREQRKHNRAEYLPTRSKTFKSLIFSLILFTISIFVFSILIILSLNKNDEFVGEVDSSTTVLTNVILSLIAGTCLIVSIILFIRYKLISNKYFTGALTLERLRQVEERIKEEEYKKAHDNKPIKCNICERLLPAGTKECIYCGNKVDVNDYFDINTNLGDKKIETKMKKVDKYAATHPFLGFRLRFAPWYYLSYGDLEYLINERPRIFHTRFVIIPLFIGLPCSIGEIFLVFLFMASNALRFISISFIVCLFIFLITLFTLISEYRDYKILKE